MIRANPPASLEMPPAAAGDTGGGGRMASPVNRIRSVGQGTLHLAGEIVEVAPGDVGGPAGIVVGIREHGQPIAGAKAVRGGERGIAGGGRGRAAQQRGVDFGGAIVIHVAGDDGRRAGVILAGVFFHPGADVGSDGGGAADGEGFLVSQMNVFDDEYVTGPLFLQDDQGEDGVFGEIGLRFIGKNQSGVAIDGVEAVGAVVNAVERAEGFVEQARVGADARPPIDVIRGCEFLVEVGAGRVRPPGRR